jgi:hypothetical protein
LQDTAWFWFHGAGDHRLRPLQNHVSPRKPFPDSRYFEMDMQQRRAPRTPSPTHPMKFQREWERTVDRLPDALASSCINYRDWKKQSKSKQAADIAEMRLQLESSCRAIDRVFCRATTECSKRTLWSRLPFSSTCVAPTCVAPPGAAAVTARDAFEFAVFNRKCVTKVCKRVDKRFKIDVMRPWLRGARDAYQFFGGRLLTRMMIQGGGHEPLECPICFETPEKVVVLHCGHSVCVECIKDMYGVGGCKGRVQALVGYANHYMTDADHRRRRRCPECRWEFPTNMHHDMTVLRLKRPA